MTWGKYYEKVGDRPNSVVVEAVENYVVNKVTAIDLGAGNMRDAKYLRSQGFQSVIAIDESPDTAQFQQEGIAFIQGDIQSFSQVLAGEPELFDFVNCCNTLFFIDSPQGIEDLFKKIFRSLRKKGVFTFNVLGNWDHWVFFTKKPTVRYFSEKQFLELCTNFTILDTREVAQFEEKEFWHYFVAILQKP